jgi:hypothetical protein
MARLTPLLVLAALLAGCVTEPRRPRVDPRVAEVIAIAAAQVQRCYRTPRVPGEGKRITVVLRARYGTDGMLIGLPELVEQRGVTPDNQVYAQRMTEAATIAVIRCTPIKLPPDLYQGGWEDLLLTFSPRAVA